MYVKHLQMLNVRGFENSEMEFSKGINLIIGANNSGKSTILKCIYELQRNNIEIAEEDIRKGKLSCKTHIELDDIQEKDRKLFIGKNVKLPFQISTKQDILFHLGRTPANTVVREHLLFEQSKGIILKSRNDIRINGMSGNPTAPTFEFERFSSMEDENNFIYPFLSKRKTEYYNAQGGRNEAYNIDHTLRSLPAKIQNLSNGSFPYSKDFEKYCEEIFDCEIGKLPGKDNQDGVGIFVTTTERIFLQSMGDGVANILGLLVILFTENNKLFLIEELENDIHPAVLKKLLSLIIEKSKNNQFIITTHSNIVLKYLASVPESKVFYTELDIIKSEGMRLPTTKVSEIENSPEKRYEILSALGYDLLDFDLYISYLIFEESSAEQIVKEFLIPEFVPELKDKIKTIAANGVNDLEPQLNDFLRLFVFIHTAAPIYSKKAWVLADGDDSGKNIIGNIKNKFRSWPEEHFINFSEPYFENYYPERFKNDFEKINSETDKNKKRDQKGKLTKSVVEWLRNNNAQAKKEMAVSAKEIINLLKEINGSL